MKKGLVLFTLVTLFALCACSTGQKLDSAPDRASPSFLGGSLGESSQPQQAVSPETTLRETLPPLQEQQFSREAGTSIDVLREEIAQAGAVFGVAYIGAYFQGEMSYEEPD